MIHMQKTLSESGRSMSKIATIIGVSIQDLSHFIRGERDRVGSASRAKIQAWMIQNAYVKPPKPRVICICPHCRAKHIMKKSDCNDKISN